MSYISLNNENIVTSYAGHNYDLALNWHDFFYILPEIQVTFFICVILIFFSLIMSSQNKRYSSLLNVTNSVSIFGLFLIFFFLKYFIILNTSVYLFNASILSSPFTLFFKKVIVLSTILIIYISKKFLKEHHNNFCEFYILVFCMTLGAMITISANDFLLVYLGLEIQALSSYVLTCLANTPISAESGLKYVLVGSFSSMLILLGISLVVYSLGTHNFNQIFLNLYCFNIEYAPNIYKIILTSGILSMLLGFLIKLGVAPFHLWLPDIYEGALLPVTLYFATTQKLVNFIIFTRIFINIFENVFYLIQPVLAVCSFICLIIGTLACVSEMKIKRFCINQ